MPDLSKLMVDLKKHLARKQTEDCGPYVPTRGLHQRIRTQILVIEEEPRFSNLKIERRLDPANHSAFVPEAENFKYLWGRLKEMVGSWKETDDIYARYGQGHALKRLMKDLERASLDGQYFCRPIRRYPFVEDSSEDDTLEDDSPEEDLPKKA